MIYVFSIAILYTLIKERKKLLETKKNLILYIILTLMGIGLGVVYLMNPYIPSISLLMEKYMNKL